MEYKGKSYYALYSSFLLFSEAESYKLSLGSFIGNVTNSLTKTNNNQKFSTYDRDNDIDSTRNCAKVFLGGWWYKNCHNNRRKIIPVGKVIEPQKDHSYCHRTTERSFLLVKSQNHRKIIPIGKVTEPQKDHSYCHRTTERSFLLVKSQNHRKIIPIGKVTEPQKDHSYW
ncbi:fibrinogen alpha chain-like [Physella acuta]|uniref:fibrinogen alpha chain-like n=1 Tax=Physella acuta TaxID=109671 RepID=UPI0027DB1D28|nr:fibrinogen alpha chain-like [Physella acuta]